MINRTRTPAEQFGFDTAISDSNRVSGPKTDNPYTTEEKRRQWSLGYGAGLDESLSRKRAAIRQREERKQREAEAEAERLANRTIREQLYEARDFGDLKAVLERMLDEREADAE